MKTTLFWFPIFWKLEIKNDNKLALKIYWNLNHNSFCFSSLILARNSDASCKVNVHFSTLLMLGFLLVSCPILTIFSMVYVIDTHQTLQLTRRLLIELLGDFVLCTRILTLKIFKLMGHIYSIICICFFFWLCNTYWGYSILILY